MPWPLGLASATRPHSMPPAACLGTAIAGAPADRIARTAVLATVVAPMAVASMLTRRAPRMVAGIKAVMAVAGNMAHLVPLQAADMAAVVTEAAVAVMAAAVMTRADTERLLGVSS